MADNNKSFPGLVAFAILAVMFAVILASSWNDSAIMDELAHIPAAYSYVTLKDMRLNPEHPPLIKDLAGIPLLLLNPDFPTDKDSWTKDINGQWIQGSIFLYESGNNPDTILHLSRLPIMLLFVLFGWLFFIWSRSLYGNKVALLSVFLYTFSPTIIAHSRYVTTDLGAAFAFFIGLAAFFRFIEKPDASRIILAGVAFGIAELLKFSLFLLVPIYLILVLLWSIASAYSENIASRSDKFKAFIKVFFPLLGKVILIGLIGVLLIWILYVWHVWNYPLDREIGDATSILSSFRLRSLVSLDLWLMKTPLLRPLGQYLLGLMMVLQRAAGGNTTYYLGEISNTGWRSYFPVAYALKETIAFHILSLVALYVAIQRIFKSQNKNLKSAFIWIKNNFALAGSIFFTAFYWLYSISTPLNIGLRHVLPTFPFIFLMVSLGIVRWLEKPTYEKPASIAESIHVAHKKFIEPIPKLIFLSLVLLWLVLSVVAAYPYYLSYYNEFIGLDNGYKYINDSNYDWGQDLKRLAHKTDELGINKIYLDYFGGGSPKYYLGDKYESWNSAKGIPPSKSYFAVSTTFLMGGLGTPIRGFKIDPADTYSWLREFKLMGRAGTSILIYEIP